MDQRNKVLLIGALAGAVTGLVAAMMLQRRAERTGSEISLSTGEGIQLGMMILGLVRSIATLADREDRR
jgi:phage protein U